MGDEQQHHHGPPSVGPKAVKMWIGGLSAVCALSVLADFTYHKHVHYPIESIPGFHALYGFFSCVLLVLAATQMRKLVMRDEEYYDRD